MRSLRRHHLGEAHRDEQGALLVAAWADATLFAGEGDEQLVVAVAALDAGEAFVQVATFEVAGDGALDRSRQNP